MNVGQALRKRLLHQGDEVKRLLLMPMMLLSSATPARAETVDLDFSLWLDGRWVCRGVLPIETDEEVELCEARHNGKPVVLHGEVSLGDEGRFNVVGRVIEGTGRQAKERNKFALLTLTSGPAELTENDGQREILRLKAEVLQ